MEPKSLTAAKRDPLSPCKQCTKFKEDCNFVSPKVYEFKKGSQKLGESQGFIKSCSQFQIKNLTGTSKK
jgi:hypothetical protein